MSTAAQSLDDVIRDASLDGDRTAAHPLPTGSIKRRLRVKAVVNLVDDHLGVTLRLHVPAHDTEGPDGDIPSLRQEGRDDGMKRTLSRGNLVWMALLKRETTTTVLKRNPGTRYDNATAKAGEVRLDHSRRGKRAQCAQV